ncbi:MAG TPA: carboxypeptidase-like regulatory domain-containing protein [Candidatus Andersenbacteria bacterium]|nr:carboxypeptidase-like regulatory domain-containing protein [Candidatus Andersenbacteria bacterium]
MTPLDILNFSLLALSIVAALLTLFDRAYHAVSRPKVWLPRFRTRIVPSHIRLVDAQTNEAVVGARVAIVRADGSLLARKTSDFNGLVTVALKPGTYRLVPDTQRLAIVPGFGLELRAEEKLYEGGELIIGDPPLPVWLAVPLRPTEKMVTSSAVRLMLMWQAIQHAGRYAAWPLLLMGAGLNTVLLVRYPQGFYIALESMYVLLVLVVIILEFRFRPSRGLVRDALTHVPLDLAVVRVYSSQANKLVLTRVTDSRGRFFALPPAGKYNLVVSKTGYSSYTQEGVEVTRGHGGALDITAELVPITGNA